MHHLDLAIVILSGLALILIAVMSGKKGRWYCNWLCPVGIILGIISKFSFYRITITEQKCNSCVLCEKTCKAGCIDSKHKIVELDRCISCFNCIKNCRQFSVEYKRDWGQPDKISRIDQSKRNFVHLLFAAAGSILIMPIRGAAEFFAPQKIVKKYPITPPGSENVTHFNNACIACHLCVSNCRIK